MFTDYCYVFMLTNCEKPLLDRVTQASSPHDQHRAAAHAFADRTAIATGIRGHVQQESADGNRLLRARATASAARRSIAA